ncbi:hypothetical protein LXL04_019525 [Taraxacum kok-saghyz]
MPGIDNVADRLEGCGNAVILEQENLVTGCSTICQNQTTSQRNNCYGINCCQISIPYYLKSYNIDTTGLQLPTTGGVYGSAFLVDEQRYSASRSSAQSAIVDNSFVPISLRWTLRQEEIGEKDCCSRERESLFLGNAVDECATCIGGCRLNGTGNITCVPTPASGKSSPIGVILEGEGMAVFDRRIVEEGGRGEAMAVAELAVRCLNLNGKNRPTLKEMAAELERIRNMSVTVTMKFLQLYLVMLISLASGATSAPIYARPGCKDMCGGIRIPYPFGIGTGCYINEWYAVVCNSSIPYLSAINNLRLLSLNMENQTVAVNVSMSSDCTAPIRNNSQILSVNLGDSPFLFSREDNKFTVEGCGNAVILEQENLVTGCSTICQNQTTSQRNNCYGINCCQISIPYYLKSYNIDTTGLQMPSTGGVCGSAFLVDEQRYSVSRSSGQSAIVDNSFVPISLRWTLRQEEIGDKDCSSMERESLFLGNGTEIESYKCTCSSFEEGSPYLANGCQAVEGCATCIGGCRLNGTGNITCVPTPARGKSSTIGVILGVSISIGVLLLTSTIFALYKLIKKTKDKRQKARFFKRNGGLLLKQQESTDEGLVDKTTLFTAKELEKATDHFNENRILGRGGQGTVYKGMLTDGRIVAVKKSKIVDESQLQQFINEVVILSQVNHRNVVKLLGCCLETEVPLLVSEFIPNGTLYEQIHNETEEFPMTLNTRLRIATEIAGALTYLHSATSIPIYHRDIKSTNILMDDKFRAKVSDFGTSRFVSIDQTHLTTLVKGTFGYLDPEYFQSSQFTEKSDVYSFGVVLVELLTGEKPISVTRIGEHRSLATHFMMAMEEGVGMAVFDRRIAEEGGRGAVMAVAELAVRCLNLNGKNRPTMKEVALELERVRASYLPTGNGFGELKYNGGKEEEMVFLMYGDDDDTPSTSTY